MQTKSQLIKFALLCLCVLPLGVAAQTADWRWREITPANATKPPARRNGVAIHDPVGNRIILFGGTGDAGFLNDTWAFALDTRTWTKLTTTGPTPPARHAFDAVYDPVGRQMVIYAGQGAGFFNDTWALNLATLAWRDVSPAQNSARPKARYGSASVYDPVSRSLVQFAGFTSEAGRFQDTQGFGLANNAWTDWTPAGAKPQVRCLLTAAFDRANRRMLIYGGQRSGQLDDLWSFDLAARAWTDVTPATRPAGRWFASAFVDSASRFILFGGFTRNGNSNETWVFDQTARQWTKLELTNSPTPRNGAQAAHIESEDRWFVFGGSTDTGLKDDLWELGRGTVTALTAVSAASFDGAAIAPDAIVAGFGTNLSAVTEAASLPLPTELAGVTIKIKDSAGTERSAPLFFVSPTQVNFLIPGGTVAGAAELTLTSTAGATATGVLPVTTVAPSLFTANASGQDVAAAFALRVRADNSQSVEPVARWDAAQNRFVAVDLDLGAENEQLFLVLFGTGLRYRASLAAVAAQIGGAPATITYAGAQGELAGLDQINLAVPRSLAGRGEVEIVLTVEGKIANTVKVRIK